MQQISLPVKHLLLAVVALSIFSACTTVRVQNHRGRIEVDRLYIRENPRVIIPEVLDLIRDAAGSRGIPCEVASADADLRGRFVITYTALRSWDIAPYLSHAEFRLEKDGILLSTAIFHLRGKGGYALTKFKSTRAKLEPVLARFLEPVVPSPPVR